MPMQPVLFLSPQGCENARVIVSASEHWRALSTRTSAVQSLALHAF